MEFKFANGYRLPKNLFGGALTGERYRVIISTDIGGSDADDFQSMVHYLLYSDLFDTEGLISSAWGAGRASDILSVIDAYEADYPKLKMWSDSYPEPNYLRSVTLQGAADIAPWKGYTAPTEASRHIIECARKNDNRPLYVLLWGLMEDLAQALHDAPDILPKLRVIYTGGPNKKWGQNAYQYIYENFPGLWIIEDNSTYRGWFNGGDMSEPWGNRSFIERFAKGHGALGEFLYSQLDGVLKMGDTPTVAYLLNGTAETPEASSWGGSFERVRGMPHSVIQAPVNSETQCEAFSVTELIFEAPPMSATENSVFTIEIQNQFFDGYYISGNKYGFRFVPKAAGVYDFLTHSEIKELDGLKGSINVSWESDEARKGSYLKYHWSDILSPELSEQEHKGAKTINQWRRDYLESFAERLSRCVSVPKE